MPTALERSPVEVQIGSWRLRSSRAHCDQELARRQGGEEEEKEAVEEPEAGVAESYVKTLTWQVGK